MNPTETFPHRCIGQAGDANTFIWQCRCGKHPSEYSWEVAIVAWGEDCPAALREALDATRAEIAEAEATLANERGEGEAPEPGFRPVLEAERPDEDDPDEDIVVRWYGAWDGECDIHVGTSAEDHLWWWSVMGRAQDGRRVMLANGRAPTARAAMRAATVAAKGGDGG